MDTNSTLGDSLGRRRRKRLGGGMPTLVGRRKKARKACQGAKGRLKKGWRYNKRGQCVRAKKRR